MVEQLVLLIMLVKLSDYDFEFGLKSSIAKFEARLYFIYYEVQSPSNKIRRQIEIPLGSVSEY